jgi:hypothetical protein
MKYYCNPLNIEYKYQFVKHVQADGEDAKLAVFREAADPSLVLFKGLYYLFPSMTAGFFTSENLIAWNFHEFLSDMPVCDYAPDVCAVGDFLYFSASKGGENCSFFRTKNPLVEPFEEIKGNFPFWDPALFHDDDGRLYFYYGSSNMTPIYGVKLDEATMKPLSKPLALFGSDNTVRGFERIGDDHVPPKTEAEMAEQAEALVRQMMSNASADQLRAYGFSTEEDVRRFAKIIKGDSPYIEGAWMTKHQGEYYLQYACPGTEFNIYADGVYVSASPLGPFVPAKNNPYSYKPGGFINGAGHGSTLRDKGGNYWHTASMTISKNDLMERRLGLWKAGFDKDGELYCDQRYGDWPIALDACAFTKPDWMLLSYGKSVKVSSGSGGENITDENIRTWWRASTNRPGEWAEVDLGKICDVRAVQVNFADENIEAQMPEGAVLASYDVRYIDCSPKQTQWLLEGSMDGEHYTILCDKSTAQSDLSHDFLVWEEGTKIRFLRLTIKHLPLNKRYCVSGIRIFGFGGGDAPKKAPEPVITKLGDLDMEVSWGKMEDVVGCNILWGYAPEKLYHSYLVFGKRNQRIGTLIKGEPIYVRLDAFNESGITEGSIRKV